MAASTGGYGEVTLHQPEIKTGINSRNRSNPEENAKKAASEDTDAKISGLFLGGNQRDAGKGRADGSLCQAGRAVKKAKGASGACASGGGGNPEPGGG